MEKDMIRLLRADEIECRVSIVKEKGLSLLLYKDARVDQRILDETFGPFGWQRSHQCIDGNLYCTVSVYDKATGTWIAKQDVGTTGYTEKEKSQASDSFKRACFNWGIGRELYSAPFIWVPAGKATIRHDKGRDRLYCNDHFSVQSIGYDDNREIEALTIVNDSAYGQAVYEMQGTIMPAAQDADAPGRKNREATATGSIPSSSSDKKSAKGRKGKAGISSTQMGCLKKELERTGVQMDEVKERYGIGQPEQMTEEIYKRVMTVLAKMGTAA